MAAGGLIVQAMPGADDIIILLLKNGGQSSAYIELCK